MSQGRQQALDNLGGLRGVGPATASLILSAAFPTHIPFFSDELYAWAVLLKNTSQSEYESEQAKLARAKNPLGKQRIKLKYSKKEYDELFDSVVHLRSACLNKLGGPSASVTRISATEIEKAAFVIMRTAAMAPASDGKLPTATLQATDVTIKDQQGLKRVKRILAEEKAEENTAKRKRDTRR